MTETANALTSFDGLAAPGVMVAASVAAVSLIALVIDRVRTPHTDSSRTEKARARERRAKRQIQGVILLLVFVIPMGLVLGYASLKSENGLFREPRELFAAIVSGFLVIGATIGTNEVAAFLKKVGVGRRRKKKTVPATPSPPGGAPQPTVDVEQELAPEVPSKRPFLASWLESP